MAARDFIYAFSSHRFNSKPTALPRRQSSSCTASSLAWRSYRHKRVVVKGSPVATAGDISSTPPTHRRSANYPPTLWDYDFIRSIPNRSDCMNEIVTSKRMDDLKEKVKHMFMAGSNVSPASQLEIVDTVQQLGLGYHFEKEIKHALDFISVNRNDVSLQGDLHFTALLFRVLRENGYEVSVDVFSSFLEEDGSFNGDILCHDIKGVLGLYEATFYAFEDEALMDNARAKSTTLLMEFIDGDNYFEPAILLEKARVALDLPLIWRMPRLNTRMSISMYAEYENMNPALLELAILDFNRVQSTHVEELKQVSRWWNNLRCREELSFARDRIVENSLWAIGMLSDPQYGYFRSCMTQIVTLIIIIDDIYDVYGSLDELELFTDAIERWGVKVADQLPSYMKNCYSTLIDIVNQISCEILCHKRVDISNYLRNAWASLCKRYLHEAKCYHNKYIPKIDEYVNNASVTIATPLMSVFTYVLIVDDVNEEILQSLYESHNITGLTSLINRLLDDMGTSEDELKRGDMHKFVQCYMHQENVTEEVARKQAQDLIMRTWKKINKERLVEGRLPKAFVDALVNLSRSCHIFYKNGDGFGVSPNKETKEYVMSLLFESVGLSDAMCGTTM